jgi:CubicO group peptidase (beta-lactamase class C family)
MFRRGAALIVGSALFASGVALAADAQRSPSAPQPTFLHNGKWKDRAIVSEKWIQMARTPGPANDVYGFANWYLNTGRKVLPNAPASAVWFEGNGNNIIYIDWENDIVAVVRWINPGPSLNDVVAKMLASITAPTQKDALAK